MNYDAQKFKIFVSSYSSKMLEYSHAPDEVETGECEIEEVEDEELSEEKVDLSVGS
jgi:hypothetical protein